MISHVDTNITPRVSARSVLEDILALKFFFETKMPDCKVIISNLVKRTDNIEPISAVEKVIELLFKLQLHVIDNSNIGTQELSFRWLHLNSKGSGKLAVNFIKKIKEFKRSWQVTDFLNNRLGTEATVCRYSSKLVFLKISQILQEKAYAGVSF